MATDYFSQFTPSGTVNLNSEYEVPDWLRGQLGMFNDGADRVNNFFNANPEYAKDYQNILNGGLSSYDTSGQSLIKSNLSSMSPEAAAHYAKNPNELMAAEGFGWDPTLAYMNYYGGPGTIGVNPKNGSVDNALRGNRWTPNGMQASNNLLGYAQTPYGAGNFAQQAQQYGSTRAPNKPMSMGGGGGSMSSTYQQNPYATQMANTLGQQMGEQFQRQIAPQIASGAQMAGGYGGSRQGVMEANAANDLSQNTGQAMGNLLGSLYGQDQQYNLGMSNLGLGYANLDRSINNDNNQWGIQGAQLGMQLQDRQLQQNQLGLSNGSQIYNNAYNNLNQYGQLYNGIGQGYGQTSQSGGGGGGNPLMGALGGLQLGNQLSSWWNSNSSGGGGGANNFWSPNFSGSMGD
jgi:hypothetical protein